MTTATSSGADSRLLAERILDTIPVTHMAFMKLLGLLDIEVTRSVPSAAVSVGSRSRLLLNPDFLEKHCRTDASLMMLVLHEMHHILLGHTRIYPRTTPAHNLVFDALINAQLCRALPDPEHTALFRDLYRPDQFPEALLRPPVEWGTPQEEWLLDGAALEAHRALYRGDDVTHAELFELLAAATEAGGEVESASAVGVDRLLGNHGDPLDDESLDPALLDAVRQIVARWPALETCSGRDVGNAPVRELVDPRVARRQVVAAMRRALASVAVAGVGTAQAHHETWQAIDTVLPFRSAIDRRAEVRAAFGPVPLQYRAVLPSRNLATHERTHVYVDVSGSMDKLIPLVYGALLPLADCLHPQVHLFSTSLANITLEDLRSGVVLTDGGTDIACVTEHMVESGVRRAAIITDGMVGPVPEQHAGILLKRRTRIAALLTDVHCDQFVRELSGRVHVLPKLD